MGVIVLIGLDRRRGGRLDEFFADRGAAAGEGRRGLYCRRRRSRSRKKRRRGRRRRERRSRDDGGQAGESFYAFLRAIERLDNAHGPAAIVIEEAVRSPQGLLSIRMAVHPSMRESGTGRLMEEPYLVKATSSRSTSSDSATALAFRNIG